MVAESDVDISVVFGAGVVNRGGGFKLSSLGCRESGVDRPLSQPTREVAVGD